MDRGPDERRLEAVYRELYAELLDSLERGAGGPFAAAVLRGDEVVGRGTNTVLASLDASRHAEINALAEAGKRFGSAPLDGATLVSTHFPCLMCYHAARWARVGRICYLFDYEETERLFGFRGDRAMLQDLRLPFRRLLRSPALPVQRVRLPALDRLYREQLPGLWAERYQARGGMYDIGPGRDP